jgi:hypothetical protein
VKYSQLLVRAVSMAHVTLFLLGVAAITGLCYLLWWAIDANAHRVALDAVDAPTLLVDHSATLRAVEQQWPKIKFHALREHAGLVFQAKM